MTDAAITFAVLLWITTIGPLTLIYLPRHIRAVHHARRRHLTGPDHRISDTKSRRGVVRFDFTFTERPRE